MTLHWWLKKRNQLKDSWTFGQAQHVKRGYVKVFVHECEMQHIPQLSLLSASSVRLSSYSDSNT